MFGVWFLKQVVNGLYQPITFLWNQPQYQNGPHNTKLCKMQLNIMCRVDRTNAKKPLWMTGKVIRSVRKKHRLWEKLRRTNKESEYIKYKRQANKASKAVRSAK